jgi:hypothetical protein
MVIVHLVKPVLKYYLKSLADESKGSTKLDELLLD